MAEAKAAAEALVPKFKLERILNQDQAGRRISLVGTVDSQPALLILERAPWTADEAHLASIPASLSLLANLGANDIYHWYVARSGGSGGGDNDSNTTSTTTTLLHDLKINLICPCTEAHIKKYSKQAVRLVTETPAIYRDLVRPYMESKRSEGRLNWVYNIIEGRKEVDDVIYRTELGKAGDQGFLLLPDLNWDRTTVEALHLLALVERRDIWSLRDLKKKHLPWLGHMRDDILRAAAARYPAVARDQFKLYVHYQPTYYHFHVHVVHVQLEAGATQATGKAVGLESIMETLKVMDGDDDAGMDRLAMSYTVGEASELWETVFGPLMKVNEAEEAAPG